ncbi:MAG: response regulator [Cyanobacteria bacterium SZAS LIN-5]|nr:response regulator [Cyanobacteria bacterium SZAS LIN-5]RTL41477.1 MAG: response regulator [Candidatus Melainabacteria bacterium]
MKILIIDDEDDVRDIASMCLGLIDGEEVLTASGGAEGLELAALHKPDVILLDLMMPIMDGSETIRRLRANSETKDIPVIFLTVKNIPSEVDRLIDLGALAVMRKPFEPTTLGSQINEIVKASLGDSARNPQEPGVN